MIRSCVDFDYPLVEALWDGFDEVHIRQSDYHFRKPSADEKKTRHDKYAFGSDSLFLLAIEEGSGRSAISGFIAGQFRTTPDVTLLKAHRLLELHAIFVRPESRGTEIADSLLCAAISEARIREAEDVVCHIWSFNGAAELLVSKAGFTRASSRYVLHINA